MKLKDGLSTLVGSQYATAEKWIISSERMKRLGQSGNNAQLWMCSGGESKVWCYKEQYCIGIRNVTSMNQGKSQVIKQETARVNIHILGIIEFKWTRMGEFNSMTIISTTVGQNPLEEME